MGDLRHLLHRGQRDVYDDMAAHPEWSRVVLEISRKWGKTWLLVVLAAESCLREPGCRVVYGAPTLKALEEFVLPVMRELEARAPDDCRPEYNQHSSHWTFPNGSWVHLFGADDIRAAERGRGPKAVRAIFDEAGFTPVLDYVLKDVFQPSLLLADKALTILGSTPSSEPEHPFTKIAEVAESGGFYFRRTIHQNPLLTPERVQDFIASQARDNGYTVEEYVQTTSFRREYLAERIADKTLVVMGDDWSDMEALSVQEVPRPQFFDAYAGLDMGGVDPHGWLGGYWHFEQAALVIEDELLLRGGENTAELAAAMQAKETALWGSTGWDGTLRALHSERTDEAIMGALPPWLREQVEKSEKAPLQPYFRVCDNDIQIARDLSVLHGMSFVPTMKTDKRWYVNEFRILVREGRLRVHPRCRNLIRHLRQTVWANPRMKTYARNAAGEHGDLLDVAIYIARNLRKNRNPVPRDWGVDKETQFIRQKPQQNPWKVAAGVARRPH